MKESTKFQVNISRPVLLLIVHWKILNTPRFTLAWTVEHFVTRRMRAWIAVTKITMEWVLYHFDKTVG